jgi:hypothetical protein
MPWRRIWTFSFCLAVLALWTFPRVEARFVSWNNDVHDWDSFAISRSRPFIADVRLESRRSSFAEIYPEKAVQERRALIPRWASSWLPMYRQTAIDWMGQSLQTFLVVVFFLGLRWMFDPDVFLGWFRRVSRRA